MAIKRVLLFMALIGMMIASSSLHVGQTADQLYRKFQGMEQAGQPERAQVGYRYLAGKLPFTAAGMSSAKMIREDDGFGRFAAQSLADSARRTSVAEWLFLGSFFLVTTVFLGSNILPGITLLPFALSAGGLFHLSFPMFAVKSPEFARFLAVNPYIYTVLTLLILAGYARKRWSLAGEGTSAVLKSQEGLSLSEELLVKEKNVEKLEAVTTALTTVEGRLTSPLGLHLAGEIDRVLEGERAGMRSCFDRLGRTLEQYQVQIQSREAEIAEAREELKENQALKQSKVINRKEFAAKKRDEEARIKTCQEEIRALRQKGLADKQVRRGFALSIGRWDVFENYLEAACEEGPSIEPPVIQGLTDRLQNASAQEKKIEQLNRKSGKLADKLANLEATRGRISEKKFDQKQGALTAEKSAIDGERDQLVLEASRDQEAATQLLESVRGYLEALNAEQTDLRILKTVKGCLKARVNRRLAELPGALKQYSGAQTTLQQVLKAYGSSGQIRDIGAVVSQRLVE